MDKLACLNDGEFFYLAEKFDRSLVNISADYSLVMGMTAIAPGLILLPFVIAGIYTFYEKGARNCRENVSEVRDMPWAYMRFN